MYDGSIILTCARIIIAIVGGASQLFLMPAYLTVNNVPINIRKHKRDGSPRSLANIGEPSPCAFYLFNAQRFE